MPGGGADGIGAPAGIPPHPRVSGGGGICNVADIHQFDVENEIGLGRNPGVIRAAVGHARAPYASCQGMNRRRLPPTFMP